MIIHVQDSDFCFDWNVAIKQQFTIYLEESYFVVLINNSPSNIFRKMLRSRKYHQNNQNMFFGAKRINGLIYRPLHLLSVASLSADAEPPELVQFSAPVAVIVVPSTDSVLRPARNNDHPPTTAMHAMHSSRHVADRNGHLFIATFSLIQG